MVRSTGRVIRARSEFAGFRFPPEVITLAVRWYLRFGLSYRDVEELLAERGVEVDHTTVFRGAVALLGRGRRKRLACQVGQMARASSVNAAATRSRLPASVASS